MNKLHGFSWTGLNYEMAEKMVDKINELVDRINKHEKGEKDEKDSQKSV